VLLLLFPVVVPLCGCCMLWLLLLLLLLAGVQLYRQQWLLLLLPVLPLCQLCFLLLFLLCLLLLFLDLRTCCLLRLQPLLLLPGLQVCCQGLWWRLLRLFLPPLLPHRHAGSCSMLLLALRLLHLLSLTWQQWLDRQQLRPPSLLLLLPLLRT
jgi:hypothetical protein